MLKFSIKPEKKLLQWPASLEIRRYTGVCTFIARICYGVSMFLSRSCLILTVGFLSCPLLSAAPASVMGAVVDSEGAVIQNAEIIIRADASGRPDQFKMSNIVLTTDVRGHFSVNLMPGFYDLCVLANAFSPSCRKILVEKKPLSPKSGSTLIPKSSSASGINFDCHPSD